ncbi:hypothetical protein SAMN06295955_11125 [Sphingopyxis indica]|uniref:Uncharacterized protein n=1 Tax=Sphingopyxis indica TaxID=436663 RepID=A0A239JQY3_9SPHN|nr:hypothetical protein SAMN06295955_11125 [Sphingopyxis indica]
MPARSARATKADFSSGVTRAKRVSVRCRFSDLRRVPGNGSRGGVCSSSAIIWPLRCPRQQIRRGIEGGSPSLRQGAGADTLLLVVRGAKAPVRVPRGMKALWSMPPPKQRSMGSKGARRLLWLGRRHARYAGHGSGPVQGAGAGRLLLWGFQRGARRLPLVVGMQRGRIDPLPSRNRQVPVWTVSPHMACTSRYFHNNTIRQLFTQL